MITAVQRQLPSPPLAILTSLENNKRTAFDHCHINLARNLYSIQDASLLCIFSLCLSIFFVSRTRFTSQFILLPLQEEELRRALGWHQNIRPDICPDNYSQLDGPKFVGASLRVILTRQKYGIHPLPMAHKAQTYHPSAASVTQRNRPSPHSESPIYQICNVS